MGISIGDKAPDFQLLDTEGETHSLAGTAPATAIVFTCNHCPYALAWHDRILDAARDYGLLYGMATALMALLIGWFASVVFRRD